uniref:hypothetical protein n=1 Tax=Azospirillum argentinense TaxID=2970906 RepID=UPI001FFF9E90|nr:hypothetical protein [Azospirillum argentinense]
MDTIPFQDAVHDSVYTRPGAVLNGNHLWSLEHHAEFASRPVCLATACALLAAGAPAAAQTRAPNAPNSPAAGTQGPAERIAAVVNDEVISLSDVHARIASPC